MTVAGLLLLSAPVIYSDLSSKKPLTLWLLAGVVVFFWGARANAGEPEYGPLLHKFPLTLDIGTKTEAAGPFYYREDAENCEQWAVPPFVARRYDKKADKLSWDFLWKAATYDRMGPESKFSLLEMFNTSSSLSLDEEGDRHFTIFPLYFQNRSDNPERNYTAVMPFYGTLRNRLFRDEIHWVMFPLYVQTRKRDVVTDNFVAPFFDVRHGDNLSGWQFWPLIGREHKGLTYKTNVVGEVEEIGPHRKSFYLWPFVMNSHTGIGKPEEEKQQTVLPFYYLERSQARDVTTLLWPFFSWTDDRGAGYREWDFPYPFVMVAKGPGKTGGRFWPLYGQAHSKTLATRFVLGPLYRSKELNSENLYRFRWRILYFLYDSLDEENTDTGKKSERRGFTPFYFYTKDFNGNSSLQILAPLEPTLPTSDSLRRCLSPLWSIWRSESNPSAGRTSQSFLWNLYRRDTSSETRKSSFLFGLFRWEKRPERRSLQLFYLPKIKFGGGEPTNVALEPAGHSAP